MDATVRSSRFPAASASVGTTQYPSSNDQQSPRHPADVNGRSQFSLHRVCGQRAVKPCDDGVSHPADWYETKDPCDYEHHTSSHSNVALSSLVVSIEVGAADPNHAERDGQYTDAKRGTDQAPGRLQVLS